MKKIAVIVAAGFGTRMGNNFPKQFMSLHDKPLIYYSVKAFLDAYDGIRIILVLPSNYLQQGKSIIENYFGKQNIHITEGGDTRFQSVKNGLKLVNEDSIVFVHDAVRCLVSVDLIHRCYDKAVSSGSAIPVIASKDSVRIITEKGNEVVDRNKVMLVQTPQTFQSKILLAAYQTEYREEFTDEATVVEAAGHTVSLVDGDEKNIKITRPADLLLAEVFLEAGS